MVINWPGLNEKEKAKLILTLSTTENWILLTHPLGTRNKSQPPFKESQMVARAEGKCSRHKEWWREGKDELASHSMTTEVWINTRGQSPEATKMAIQEALEEENTKDAPSFGTEDLEEIHRSGTEAGLLGIYNFPGAVYGIQEHEGHGKRGPAGTERGGVSMAGGRERQSARKGNGVIRLRTWSRDGLRLKSDNFKRCCRLQDRGTVQGRSKR